MAEDVELSAEVRRSILDGEGTKEIIRDGISDIVESKVQQFLSPETGETRWDVEGLVLFLKTDFGLDVSSKKDELNLQSKEQIKESALNSLLELYEQKEKVIGPDHLRYLERMIILQNIDIKWKDHLYAMDQLKEGINLRAYGQRDPLVEYQREAFSMFQSMHASIYEEVVETIFRVQAVSDKEKPKGVFSSIPQQLVHNEFSSLAQVASQAGSLSTGEPASAEETRAVKPYHKTTEKVGRNDPCPCGSGKKYKKCCGS
jgi:preprotein translocase subunit SecA